MITSLEPIHIVWLKRDLRLEDHNALAEAINSKKRVLLLYVFENILFEDPHYSPRHFDFIKESLRDMNQRLISYKTAVCVAQGELIEILDAISKKFNIETIHAHQETGVLTTYQRDKNLTQWCRNKKVIFKEYLQQGVFRGLKNRNHWLKKWLNMI